MTQKKEERRSRLLGDAADGGFHEARVHQKQQLFESLGHLRYPWVPSVAFFPPMFPKYEVLASRNEFVLVKTTRVLHFPYRAIHNVLVDMRADLYLCDAGT